MIATGGDDRTVRLWDVCTGLEIVSRYARRVLAFYDGRIIADAEPEAVLQDPQVQRLVTGAVT